MTIEKYKHKTNVQSNRKGKYATSTENRRLMWEYIVWPLVLQLNKSYFTIEEYHKMRDKVSIENFRFKNGWRHGISPGQGNSHSR